MTIRESPAEPFLNQFLVSKAWMAGTGLRQPGDDGLMAGRPLDIPPGGDTIFLT